MLVNQIINVSEDFGSGEVSEPVTLQQAKDYMRLGGFTDQSGEQDFDFDDTLIQAIITEGRLWVENFTGQYLVPRTLTVVLLNQAGGIELPGPVIGSIVYTNPAGDSIADSLRVVGTPFPKIVSRWYGNGESSAITRGYCTDSDYITAVYEAGYSVIPKWAEIAILSYLVFRYEHRGEEADVTGNPTQAANICRPYRKVKAFG